MIERSFVRFEHKVAHCKLKGIQGVIAVEQNNEAISKSMTGPQPCHFCENGNPVLVGVTSIQY